ncbi:MAG: 30S ribosomal protein S14 [Candidatus Altarchaeaceae archaeon]
MEEKKGAQSRKFAKEKCSICGTHRGVINKYNLMICRRCFREVAKKLGFEKYN